ncbi:MAG: polysaccharide pyruvyl transferase family protein, partial [Candidatus Margulisbacteria bacterium]|nr:polysaccharide pyruvyl transferase family protein [Candidatus Margulisiibacteriota bacterium]
MRKILLAGYYGFGNLGDELLARTMAKFLTERGFQINIIKKRSSFWRQIRKNDCLLFAGGSVFQDVSGRGFSLLYYAFWGFVAKLLGKKLFLAAQGIGPVACLFDRYILRVLLRCADFISVRDKRSAELLRKIGCKHFQTGVDLLFALKAKIYVKSGQKVAVNLRPFGHFRPEQGVRILTGRDVVYVPLQNGVDYGRGM